MWSCPMHSGFFTAPLPDRSALTFDQWPESKLANKRPLVNS
jgi:hypothetical protein